MIQAMRIHWGAGIAIVYGLFVVLMIGFVIRSRDIDHSLVMDNYYEEDLTYQVHLNKVANAKALSHDLSIVEDETRDALTFQFPPELKNISGEVWLYRASDTSRDLKLPITTTALNTMTVPTRDLISGKWSVKVDWNSMGKSFYSEKDLYIQ